MPVQRLGIMSEVRPEPESDPAREAVRATSTSEHPALSEADRHALLKLARQSVERAARDGEILECDAADMGPALLLPGACFVTLRVQGRLRGCIGTLNAHEPLYLAALHNAHSAAIRDRRFAPVAPEEVPGLSLEISVLTPTRELSFRSPSDLLAKLEPHHHGVVLRLGGFSATFLPQVWEQIPDKEQFLNHLAQKAGCQASAWREPGTRVSIYEVEAFEEPATSCPPPG